MSIPPLFTLRAQKEVVRLTGRDRLRFLQGMVTNEVASLEPGKGCYAFHLTSKGQVVADLHVLCQTEALLLVTEPGWGEPLAAALEHHLVMERVRVQAGATEEVVVIGGKAAGATLEELGFLGAVTWQEGENASLGAAGTLFRCALGFVAVGDFSALEPALEAKRAVPLEPAVFLGLRIEAGIPQGRVDFEEKTLALETGQAGRAIHFKKGCYLGQEIVARIDARGHTNRGLVGLASDLLLTPGDRLFVEGKDSGWVTSAAIGPTRGAPLALGYLRHECATPGTRVEAGGRWATVVGLPFVEGAS